MAEARKAFSIDTFAEFLKGSPAQGYNHKVVDLLSHVTQKNVDEDFQLFAAALSKAWIYEQHPELTKLAGHELAKYGENVSMPPLPEDEMSVADAIFARLTGYRLTIAEQAKTILDLEKRTAKLEKELAAASAKVAEFEKREKSGEQRIVASKAKVDEYLNKLDDLLAKIEEVKKHGVVTVAGGGGAAGAAPTAESGGGDAGSTDPQPDFGFGSGSSDDGFGF